MNRTRATRRRELGCWLVVAVSLETSGCRSERRDPLPRASANPSCAAPFVVERTCCSDCLEGKPSLDWAEQWRRGLGFGCEGRVPTEAIGNWRPENPNNEPRLASLSLEVFADGFVVRNAGTEHPWRAILMGTHDEYALWACPWRDRPNAPKSDDGCQRVELNLSGAARSKIAGPGDVLSSAALEAEFGVSSWRFDEVVEFDFAVPSWRPERPLPPLAISR